MRDYARDWMASFVSFARGHGGGGNASASVGAAFVIGALLVAVLGLRWVGAEGGSKDGTEETPWEFTDAANVDTSTTIPASTPAKVVPIPDPDAAGPGEPSTTTTTRPGQKVGIFLPGYSPTPGGGVGPSTTIRPTTTRPPRTTTTQPGGGTTTTTAPPDTTTTTEATTTTEPTTTTEDTTTTTEDTLPPEGTEDLSRVVQDRINQQFDALGWPFS